MNPLRDPVLEIAGVGVDFDRGRTIERFKRADRRHELHPVVGGESLAPRQLLLPALIFEDGAPPARAGIAGTGAVGMDDDLAVVHAAGFASRSSRGSLNDTVSSLSVIFSTET